MESQFEHIDQIFHYNLDNVEVKPAADAWENIMLQLNANKKKRRITYIRRIAAVFAFVITMLTGFFIATELGTINTNITSTDRQNENLNLSTQRAGVNASPDYLTDQPINVTDDNISTDSGNETTAQLKNGKQLATALNGNTKNKSFQSNTKFFTPPVIDSSEVESPETTLKNNIAQSLDQPIIKQPGLSENMAENDGISNDIKNNNISLANDYLNNSNIYPEKKNNLKVKLSGVAAPIYAMASVENSTNNNLNQLLSNGEGTNNTSVSAYTAGVKVNIGHGKRFSVETGIMYASLSQTHEFDNFERKAVALRATKSVDSQDRMINNGNNGPQQIGPNQPQSASTLFETQEVVEITENTQTINNNLEYLEIPVSVKYKLIDRKLNLNFIGGMSTHLLIAGEQQISSSKGNSSSLNISAEVDPLKYSSHVGLGLEYPLFNGLVFLVEPTVKYYLNDIESLGQTSVNPFALGLYTGVNLSF